MHARYLPPLHYFQVVQSLRLQSSSSSKNYSELGSCPTLNSGSRALLARSISGAVADGDEASRPVEESVQTATGKITVARQGDPRKPALITYHDIALNYASNFQVSNARQRAFWMHLNNSSVPPCRRFSTLRPCPP